jgi:uncharacterized protein (TIGR04222 family)
VWRILALGTSRLEAAESAVAPLTPIEAGYLVGGAPLAMRVATAGLFSAGLLGEDGRVVDEPSPGEELDPLRVALLAALARGQASAVHLDPTVVSALHCLQSNLVARQLLLAPRRRRLVGFSVLPLVAVAVIGGLHLLNQAGAAGPDWALVTGVAVVAALCLGILATIPRRTRLGIGLTQAGEISYPSATTLHRSVSR